ncbi:hypothetical protein GCM10007094_44140 [Pseudovibrio japonicus]|uniref:Immunity MXAN-0049 protein domain-containing protein n=1 Tax=Pseudovibrio japonicus TaxID=366534 RepID=A0ABQ3EPH1_9HYPH|nr:DUF1629 domain-containing protein [Pseudovibrio japonicus]GHB50053.1 hypothetical protein GCM10007094_44140 [Pseudovibrio japonicus]
MQNAVWISYAMMDETKFLPIKSDISLSDVQRAIDAQTRNVKGEPLAREHFPERAYGNAENDAPIFDKLPDIFSCGGYWVVSESCADVLAQFNLGRGALHPIEIFQRDHRTPVPGRYFCLNFGCVKEVFLPGESPRARKDRNRAETWKPPFVLKNEDIAVSETALNGCDLWIDPRMARAFFVSDDLAKALKAAKVNLGLRRCRVL